MNNETQRIVAKAWNFAHVLRDVGLSYMAYTEQITFLLFLKMADELTRPPHSKRTHLNDILVALEAEEPKQKTDIFDVLRHVAEAQGRRGMIVLVSDLLVPRPGLFKGLKLLRHRGHDVLVFHVLDDEELDFNFAGTTKFEGLEQLGDILCDPRSLRDGYLAALHTYLDDLRRFCAQQVIDYRTIRTSEHIDAVLLHYMNHRLGMHRN